MKNIQTIIKILSQNFNEKTRVNPAPSNSVAKDFLSKGLESALAHNELNKKIVRADFEENLEHTQTQTHTQEQSHSHTHTYRDTHTDTNTHMHGHTD